MKVLRVIASMDPASGGPCQGIRNAIPEMKKLGVHTEVVCLDRPDASFIALDNFAIYALGPGKTSWAYAPLLMPWLLAKLKDYDVVVVHGLWQYHGHAVRKALQKLKHSGENKLPSCYVMPHGMLDPYFQKASGRKLKAIRNWFYWKLIESNIINQADGVLFTCEEELRLARVTFTPYHPKKELNVGYGIEAPPVFQESMQDAFAEKCPEIQDQKYILFLSRIHTKKGVDLLVTAYKNILEKMKDCPLLVIAGPGMESPYGLSLKQTVDNHPQMRQKVFFPGMLSGDAKWGAFYGADAFILPSHQENFGISVAEALACHQPVLISDQVNIWREIEQAGAGFVAADTLEGTLQLLEKWISLKSDDQQKMSENAYKAYETNFAIAPAAKLVFETLSQHNN